MSKALARRIMKLEGPLGSDPYAGMTLEELKLYLKEEFKKLAAEIGGYDMLVEAFRCCGMADAADLVTQLCAEKSGFALGVEQRAD